MARTRGKFITIEGVEGCGKSTQTVRLCEFLRRRGIPLVETKQPGGTEIGQKIRQILLHTDHKKMTPVCEALLYLADRAQHHVEVISPQLEAGNWVVCDRYQDSTLAYQGAARGLDPQSLDDIFRMATGNLQPDLTLLLDLEPGMGVRRARARNVTEQLTQEEGRFEEEALVFHQEVRRSFLALAEAAPHRFEIIPVDGTADQVFDSIRRVLENRWVGCFV